MYFTLSNYDILASVIFWGFRSETVTHAFSSTDCYMLPLYHRRGALALPVGRGQDRWGQRLGLACVKRGFTALPSI